MVRVPKELLFKQFRDGAGGAPPVHITERVMQPEVEPQPARWVQNLTVPEKVATQVAEPDAPKAYTVPPPMLSVIVTQSVPMLDRKV